MIGGEEIRLDEQEQLIVVRWGLKTLMMFEWTDPKHRSVPDSFYRRFYEGALPPAAVVWLARYIETDTSGNIYKVPPNRTSWWSHTPLEMRRPGFPEPDGPNGYGATLSIGQLVFQVVSFFIDEVGPITRRPRPEDLVVEILPTHPLVVWPPRVALTKEGLTRFAQSMPTTGGPPDK